MTPEEHKELQRQARAARAVLIRWGYGPGTHCGARRRTGDPCQRPPVFGGRRCRLHGGLSPNAVAAGRARVQAAYDLTMRMQAAGMNEEEQHRWDLLRAPLPAALQAVLDGALDEYAATLARIRHSAPTSPPEPREQPPRSMGSTGIP